MKQLTCEMCGSTDLMKQDGVFVCQTCGTKYSVEEAKKMMVEGTVEVAGTVKVDDTSKIDNYYKMAEEALEAENYADAEKYCNKVIEIDTDYYKAYFLKGTAVGWQSTALNNRIKETLTLYEKAIKKAPEADNFDLHEKVYELSYKFVLLGMEMFCKKFTDELTEETKNDVFDYTDFVIDDFYPNFIHGKNNNFHFDDIIDQENFDSYLDIPYKYIMSAFRKKIFPIRPATVPLGDPYQYRTTMSKVWKEFKAKTQMCIDILEYMSADTYILDSDLWSLNNVNEYVSRMKERKYQCDNHISDKLFLYKTLCNNCPEHDYDLSEYKEKIIEYNDKQKELNLDYQKCIIEGIKRINPNVTEGYIKSVIPEYISTSNISSNKDTESQKSPAITPANNAKNTKLNSISTSIKSNKTTSAGGCYVATAVYGSYDCPQVWTLRRYRDFTLAKTWYGRLFIKIYYAVSPTLVKWFGKTKWFKNLWQGMLDRMVTKLQSEGVESTPYEDREW